MTGESIRVGRPSVMTALALDWCCQSRVVTAFHNIAHVFHKMRRDVESGSLRKFVISFFGVVILRFMKTRGILRPPMTNDYPLFLASTGRSGI